MMMQLFFLVFCLILSAFFSGSEMAFVSVNDLKLREMADSGRKSAKILVGLKEDAQHFLTTILIGNNIVNVAATALLTVLLSQHFGIENEWVVTAIMTPVLLIFGEVVPKDYARQRPLFFLTSCSLVLAFVSRMFSLLTSLMLHVVHFFLAPLGAGTRKSIFVNEEEFRSMIEEGRKSGIVGHHEKRIIDTILDFEKIQVQSVMTPVERVPCVEIHARVGEVKELAAKTQSRMFLVYEEDPSIIVGMIYTFDILFEDRGRAGLRDFLRSPIFIRQDTSLEKAFFTLQQKRQSYAVVFDHEQEVCGVVPIEQLLVVT